ncbi:MAG: hypothetical protein MUC50_18105 [Myxococcota bacterium]|jgi:hypothetical protein|nr:hypothetical protein [Myxococcota bacterium]
MMTLTKKMVTGAFILGMTFALGAVTGCESVDDEQEYSEVAINGSHQDNGGGGSSKYGTKWHQEKLIKWLSPYPWDTSEETNAAFFNCTHPAAIRFGVNKLSGACDSGSPWPYPVEVTVSLMKVNTNGKDKEMDSFRITLKSDQVSNWVDKWYSPKYGDNVANYYIRASVASSSCAFGGTFFLGANNCWL